MATGVRRLKYFFMVVFDRGCAVGKLNSRDSVEGQMKLRAHVPRLHDVSAGDKLPRAITVADIARENRGGTRCRDPSCFRSEQLWWGKYFSSFQNLRAMGLRRDSSTAHWRKPPVRFGQARWPAAKFSGGLGLVVHNGFNECCSGTKIFGGIGTERRDP